MHYSLDMIISVGYRVNSKKATKFRQWATIVLRQYIYNGYTINSEKITHQRFTELENNVNILKSKVNTIDNLISSDQLEVKQGVYSNGEVFAFSKIDIKFLMDSINE